MIGPFSRRPDIFYPVILQDKAPVLIHRHRLTA